jgi:cytochrome P450
MALLEINAAFLSTIFIGLLLVLAYCSRWRRYFELGLKLPGPPALPFIGNCLHFSRNDLCTFFKEFRDLGQSYAPIARLWFGPALIVVVTDADSIESVAKQDKSCSSGYRARKTMETIFQNGQLGNDGDSLRKLLKSVSSVFNINNLEIFVDNFAKNSEILANKLKDLADGVTAHNIVPCLTRCTLDIITQTTASVNINAQNGNDETTLNNITTILDTSAMKFLKPWLFIEWIFRATELGKKYYKAVQCVHGKITNAIGKKKRTRETTDMSDLNDEKPTVVDLLTQFAYINKEEIVGDIVTIIGAGAEITSNSCGYMLALLGENQHVQAKVMQEQQDIFGDDILRRVRSDDLPRMVYLDQVGY